MYMYAAFAVGCTWHSGPTTFTPAKVFSPFMSIISAQMFGQDRAHRRAFSFAATTVLGMLQVSPHSCAKPIKGLPGLPFTLIARWKLFIGIDSLISMVVVSLRFSSQGYLRGL